MNDIPPKNNPPSTLPNGAVVNVPGAKRTDFPDGSQLFEGPDGDKFLVSETGDISATMPFISQVQIEDIARVTSHEIVQMQDTTSHTLHFVGGGVFSYLHHRNGNGISIQAHRIMWRTLPGGVIIVQGANGAAP
jgi:hypothetical protein